MCGICGKFSFNGSVVDKQAVTEMNRMMVHRGPDDEGYYITGEIGLGMRRLAIIDLEKGRQPISGEDGRYTVVLNGEIYNYIELKKDLQKSGHVFKTNSDTEVLVHMFEEKRVDCVAELNGMFAFAVWDDLEKELFLFRDRLGIKPLFYTVNSDCFLFSSDLSSLRSACPKNKEIEFNSFLRYLGLSYTSYPETIFKDIFKLEPGHFLKISRKNSIVKKRYWDIYNFNTISCSSLSDCKDHVLSLLRDSIALQMRSDVPIGTFLSGGIDSSCIVALLSEKVSWPVKTFSVGFEGGLNELPYARIVARKFKTDHFELKINGNEILSVLPE
ncbi:MAG: asparagine synthase (glutamine-hydrolyzing), partial [Candidatus Anammoxibacter sp.]